MPSFLVIGFIAGSYNLAVSPQQDQPNLFSVGEWRLFFSFDPCTVCTECPAKTSSSNESYSSAPKFSNCNIIETLSYSQINESHL